MPPDSCPHLDAETQRCRAAESLLAQIGVEAACVPSFETCEFCRAHGGPDLQPNVSTARLANKYVPTERRQQFLARYGALVTLSPAIRAQTPPGPLGVGGHLKKLFAERFGWPPCQVCHETAREMDALGPAGCRRELERLVRQIEANSRNVLANQPGLMAGIARLLPGGLKRAAIKNLVLEAISAAEKGGTAVAPRPFVAPAGAAAASPADAGEAAAEDDKPFPASPRIAAIVPLFNPAGYKRRTENYLRAMDHYAQLGFDRLLTIEAVFPGQKWKSVGDRIVIEAHDGQRLWQKERLINIGIEELAVNPPDAVAWLDADLEWEQPERLRETLRLALQQYQVVQPFHEVAWLSESGGVERTYNSWARRKSGRRTPGFAWCARWSLVRGGLFDQAIVGGADAYMACAWSGDTIHPKQTMPPGLHAAWEKWRPQQIVTVGDVHLRIRHHWHGRRSDRGYVQRIGFLRKHEFDPFHDIRIGDNRLWEWTGRNPALIASEALYFSRRREDGVQQ